MSRIVAIHKTRAEFLNESPSDTLNNRVQSHEKLSIAKKDFADQAAIDAYVTARGGDPSLWVALELPDAYGGP